MTRGKQIICHSARFWKYSRWLCFRNSKLENPSDATKVKVSQGKLASFLYIQGEARLCFKHYDSVSVHPRRWAWTCVAWNIKVMITLWDARISLRHFLVQFDWKTSNVTDIRINTKKSTINTRKKVNSAILNTPHHVHANVRLLYDRQKLLFSPILFRI